MKIHIAEINDLLGAIPDQASSEQGAKLSVGPVRAKELARAMIGGVPQGRHCSADIASEYELVASN